jgi:4-hydroxy-2-oxoglutarate aldolase
MNLTGVLAPIPTPFDAAGRLDLARLRKALRHWLRTPLTGIVVLGSTGEAALVDEAESTKVIAAARDVVPRTRTFIVGTGRESTQATVRASKRAAALGADAVLVRTPGFYKDRMTSEALIEHYMTVADRSPVPVLLYNFRALTGVNLQADAIARLARHQNIAGIKESGGDVMELSDRVAAASDTFHVLAGSATTFHQALSLGAVGGILAFSCVAPDLCTRLFALARAGRHDEAGVLQQRIVPLTRLFVSVHGIPGLKAALNLAGCDVGEPRRPLLPVSEAVVEELRGGLAALDELRGSGA